MSLAAEIIRDIFPVDLQGPVASFWMIPGHAGQPRWIVPVSSKLGLPVLRQWQPYNLNSRLQWQVVLNAYRFNWMQAIPGIVKISVPVPTHAFWQQLGWKRETPPVPVMYIGTPGSRSRKAVVTLMDAVSLEPVSVAKIPLEAQAGEKIRHEAEVLQTLGAESLDLVPNLAFYDSQRWISMQNFKPGRGSGVVFSAAHRQWLLQLSRAPALQTSADFLEGLAVRFKALDCGRAEKTMFDQSLRTLSRGKKVPSQWVHGDFAPWNIKLGINGNLAVVDWEEATPAGLPLYDALYFHLIQSVLYGRKLDVAAWLQAPAMCDYIQKLGLSDEQIGKIIRCTLLSYWCRKLELGDQVLAHRFLQLMLPILEAAA